MDLELFEEREGKARDGQKSSGCSPCDAHLGAVDPSVIDAYWDDELTDYYGFPIRRSELMGTAVLGAGYQRDWRVR